MDTEAVKIKSITGFWGFLNALPDTRTRIYRGQNTARSLLPTYWREARRAALRDPLQAEQQLLDTFRRLSHPYLERLPSDTFEWLAVAQHHGLPTRLLDWSGNPLFALWFAVRNGPSSVRDEDGVFWALDVQEDHYVPPTEKKKDVYELRRTRVFRPPHINERIVAQDGWFTVHWYIEKQNKFVPLEKQARFKSHIHGARVPRVAFPDLQAQLRKLGISDRVLFPDLVTLCKELSAEFFR